MTNGDVPTKDTCFGSRSKVNLPSIRRDKSESSCDFQSILQSLVEPRQNSPSTCTVTDLSIEISFFSVTATVGLVPLPERVAASLPVALATAANTDVVAGLSPCKVAIVLTMVACFVLA